MNRRGAGYGGIRRGARASRGLIAPPLAALGDDLLYRWRVDLDGSPNVTVAAGRITVIANIDAYGALVGSADMTVLSTGLLYQATGGPSNDSHGIHDLAAANLQATISIASGSRIGVYGVGILPAAAGAQRWSFALNDATDDARVQAGVLANGNFYGVADMTDATRFAEVTTPAGHTDWDIFSPVIAFDAGDGGTQLQIGGVVTDPDYSGSSGVAGPTLAHAGNEFSLAQDASFKEMFIVGNITTAKHEIALAYAQSLITV